MSEVFEGYERQYCELSANLSRKCSSASLVSGQGTLKIQTLSSFHSPLLSFASFSVLRFDVLDCPLCFFCSNLYGTRHGMHVCL